MLKISGKIPVSIYPFFWILAAIIGWINTNTFEGTFVWMFIILVSVLVHEYGHALTAVACGQQAEIDLVGFGGLTKRKGITKLWQELLIVLNGPLAGFLLCLVAWWAANIVENRYPESLLAYTLGVTFYVNLFWTVLNLVPVQPLDGGKLLSTFLELLFGLKGVKIAFFLSTIIAATLGIAFFAFQWFLVGSLFFIFTYESYRSWKNSLSVTPQDQNFLLQHVLKSAEQDIKQGNNEEALKKLQHVRKTAQSGMLHQIATEHMAHLKAEKGEYDTAYDLLTPMKKQLSNESISLLHQLAYRQGAWEEAIAIGDRVYRADPRYDTAIINAISHAVLGHARPAIGWLQCAVREGGHNLNDLLSKKEFDPIRHDPLFQQFQNTLT